MPFLQDGGSVEANLVGSRAGSSLPPARLVVDPDQILALKHGIEQEQLRVKEWLVANGHRLNTVRQPGTDPCSGESAGALGENGEAAVRAADGYVVQLGRVVDALGEVARGYRLMEDKNTGRLGGGAK